MNKDESNIQESEYRGTANSTEEFDYTYVNSTARIALYDDMRSAPRITEIHPAETSVYIEKLTDKVYEQAKMAGGNISYTIIREVAENFIHAKFTEIIVSIFDDGNTIRFADQGPGIQNKDKAQLPGFSSAIEPMKGYIRGVGSGFPLVKEYLDFSHGSITIDDNLVSGAVVTISLNKGRSLEERKRTSNIQQAKQIETSPTYPQFAEQRMKIMLPPISPRQKAILKVLLSEEVLGVTEISKLTDIAASSTHVELGKMEEAGLIMKTNGKKRMLTDLGYQAAVEAD